MVYEAVIIINLFLPHFFRSLNGCYKFINSVIVFFVYWIHCVLLELMLFHAVCPRIIRSGATLWTSPISRTILKVPYLYSYRSLKIPQATQIENTLHQYFLHGRLKKEQYKSQKSWIVAPLSNIELWLLVLLNLTKKIQQDLSYIRSLIKQFN